MNHFSVWCIENMKTCIVEKEILWYRIVSITIFVVNSINSNFISLTLRKIKINNMIVVLRLDTNVEVTDLSYSLYDEPTSKPVIKKLGIKIETFVGFFIILIGMIIVNC